MATLGAPPTPRTLAAMIGAPVTPGLRVGLLGGSFNPAHEGHLHISLEALARLQLDQVWWLVSPQNPLKSADDMAAMEQRTAHAAALVQHPKIRVCTLEAQLGTRFTAETLAALTSLAPEVNFVWLMGADNLVQLPQWRDWESIMCTVPVAVFARPGHTRTAAMGRVAQSFAKYRVDDAAGSLLPLCEAPAWTLFHSPLHPQSASAIRSQSQWPPKN